MTTAKSEVLIGLLLKNCYSVEAMNLLGQIFASDGDFPSSSMQGNPVQWIYFENYFALCRDSNAQPVGLQVTDLLSRPKGFIRTEMKFLAHEILHFGFFSICVIKALKVGISMQYGAPVPLGKPVLFLWRVSSFIIGVIFLCLQL